MLENNNLSYTSQNHSSVTILKQFVDRWQMNITAEIKLPSMIPNLRYRAAREIIQA